MNQLNFKGSSQAYVILEKRKNNSINISAYHDCHAPLLCVCCLERHEVFLHFLHRNVVVSVE